MSFPTSTLPFPMTTNSSKVPPPQDRLPPMDLPVPGSQGGGPVVSNPSGAISFLPSSMLYHPLSHQARQPLTPSTTPSPIESPVSALTTVSSTLPPTSTPCNSCTSYHTGVLHHHPGAAASVNVHAHAHAHAAAAAAAPPSSSSSIPTSATPTNGANTLPSPSILDSSAHAHLSFDPIMYQSMIGLSHPGVSPSFQANHLPPSSSITASSVTLAPTGTTAPSATTIPLPITTSSPSLPTTTTTMTSSSPYGDIQGKVNAIPAVPMEPGRMVMRDHHIPQQSVEPGRSVHGPSVLSMNSARSFQPMPPGGSARGPINSTPGHAPMSAAGAGMTSGHLPLNGAGGMIAPGHPIPRAKEPIAPINSGNNSNMKRRRLGGTRHQCPQCSRTFSRREHVRRHLRTHTDERPYPCRWPGCQLRFARPDNRNAHHQAHERHMVKHTHAKDGVTSAQGALTGTEARTPDPVYHTLPPHSTSASSPAGMMNTTAATASTAAWTRAINANGSGREGGKGELPVGIHLPGRIPPATPTHPDTHPSFSSHP